MNTQMARNWRNWRRQAGRAEHSPSFANYLHHAEASTSKDLAKKAVKDLLEAVGAGGFTAAKPFDAAEPNSEATRQFRAGVWRR